MIRVWDPFVRLFHWSLVAIVISNRFINESGDEWHEWLGYLACALIAARILWGFKGSEYARFKNLFSSWPARGRFRAHLRDYLMGRTPRTINHSPLAVIGMSVMLVCILLLGLTGWMMSWDRFFGEEWLEETHEVLANVLIAFMAVHVAGVLRESILHRENLIASMIHGKKRRD